MLLKRLTAALLLGMVPFGVFAEDTPSITYTFDASSPPWLDGLETQVGEGTDFNVLPCQRSPCALAPTQTLDWGGLRWSVQGWEEHSDHDCIYHGKELAVLVAPLPNAKKNAQRTHAVFMAVQMHRAEECDWSHEYYWKQAAVDLDGDGVTELCVEELREHWGVHPTIANWAYPQQRVVRAYSVDTTTGVIEAQPELVKTCPDSGYDDFVSDAGDWP